MAGSILPYREICLDESMIAFKGKTGAMVYQSKKPHKWGMQAWFLADSRTAYFYNRKIYSGKRTDNVDSGVGVTHATVIHMVQPCIDRGHHMYFDNYYTSPAVLKNLSSKGFGACGTLRVNRKDVPPVIKSANVKPGNPPVSVHHDISWMDKRQENLATTIHDDSVQPAIAGCKVPLQHQVVTASL